MYIKNQDIYKEIIKEAVIKARKEKRTDSKNIIKEIFQKRQDFYKCYNNNFSKNISILDSNL